MEDVAERRPAIPPWVSQEVEEILIPTDRKAREQAQEGDLARLFFGALFRLGIYAPDWETWYGTRRLDFARPERRFPGIHDPAGSSPTR